MAAALRAIVTGGASGLGLAAATRLAAAGAHVVIADLPSSSGEEAAASIGATFAPADVTSEEQVNAALDVLETKAGAPVNAAVNCAGVAVAIRTWHPKKGAHPLDVFENVVLHSLPEGGPRVPTQSSEEVLRVNTLGSFNVIRLAASRMAVAEPDAGGFRGAIVNTASIAAMDGQGGQSAYAASKAAIAGMTLPIARDLAKSAIRVNTIAPGLFKTPLLAGLPDDAVAALEAGIPCPQRLGNPDEFAMLVEQMLTNTYFNGEVVRLDGALRMQ